MEAEIEPGTTVYTADGHTWVYVVAVPGGGHVVRPVLEDDDGWTRFSSAAQVVDEVSTKPPRHRIEAEHAELKAEAGKLRAELRTLRDDRRAILKEEKDLAKLRPVLGRLRDFLDDRITHVVHEQFGKVGITTLAEALESEDPGYPEKRKLLTLFGDTKGDLSWQLSRCCTGGNEHQVHPCTSEEEAREVARELIASKLESADPRYIQAAWIDCADKFGVPVPPLLREQKRQADRAQLLRTLRRNEERAALAREKLAAFDQKTAPPSEEAG